MYLSSKDLLDNAISRRTFIRRMTAAGVSLVGAQAMAQSSGRLREMMLRKIAAALTRIDNDDYGFCKSCEEEIHRKRLEFDPTAVLCIQCAKKAEDLSAR